jgi:hypothetical protein
LDDPHTPLTGVGFSDAVHCAAVPPLLPVQLQFHGPLPVTDEAVPVVQRLAVGLLLKLSPFDEPQAPFSGVVFSEAKHSAVVPPLLPAQLQSHGPLPVTDEAVPVVQRLAFGSLLRLSPLDNPHAPFTAAGLSAAEHCAAVPPLLPVQLQSHGPLPVTDETVPVVHRLVVGLLVRLSPFDEPQAPLTGVGFSDAVHNAVAPPLLPAQLQSQGPLPVTDEAVPVVQRLMAGLLLKLSPFDEPQAPFTGLRVPLLEPLLDEPPELEPELLDPPPEELPATVPPLELELDPAPELELVDPELEPPPWPACCCSCWICCSRFWINCSSCCIHCCSIAWSCCPNDDVPLLFDVVVAPGNSSMA